MRRTFTFALGLVAIAGSALQAQSGNFCASRLSEPAPDSVVVTFGASIASFDDKRALPREYATLLAEGLRQELRLPSPLLFMAFQAERTDTSATTRAYRALPTLSALYSVTLDGTHLRNARLLTGTVSPGFDLAVQHAFAGLDSSGDIPPLPDSTNPGPLELRVVIEREKPSRASASSDSVSSLVPLFRVRLPARAATQTVGPRPGVRNEPVIPRDFRPSGTGSILVEIRVSETGEIDPASLRIVSYSSLDLARAVFPRVAQLKLQPLLVEGCPVTALETLGFGYVSTPARVR